MEKLLLIVTAASALCAVSSLSTREYRFVYEQKTWQEAQTYCRERYTDLVTIENMEVVKILQSMANLSQMIHPVGSYPAWIGLYEDLNTWRWSMSNSTFYQKGEELYRNWAQGAPDNGDGREACAVINAAGVWDDVPCSSSLNPVCSVVNARIEQNLFRTVLIHPFNPCPGTAATFVYVATTMNWFTARNYCRDHHTDLASVRNPAESQAIHDLHPKGSVWIGLYRNTWMWSDGARTQFWFWKYVEPNGPTDCCVAAVFASSGMWEDWACDQRIGFICYWDVPVLARVVRLKLVNASSLDLNGPAVMEDLLNQLQQKLKEQLKEGMKIRKLSWKKQPDGNVFLKEKKK